jgi:hypothetical protein
MKMKAFIFLLLAIPLGSWIPVPNFNTLNYDILVSDTKIGEMRAIKNERGAWATYSIHTNISFRVFESYDINYQLSSSYKNNVMMETVLKNIVNGATENNMHLKWDGTKYQGHNNADKISVSEKIRYSTARMYFHEPLGIEKVFSEKFVVFQPLRINRKNEYILHLEDGNKSKYTYVNGICTEVHTSKNLVKINIKLRSSS